MRSSFSEGDVESVDGRERVTREQASVKPGLVGSKFLHAVGIENAHNRCSGVEAISPLFGVLHLFRFSWGGDAAGVDKIDWHRRRDPDYSGIR